MALSLAELKTTAETELAALEADFAPMRQEYDRLSDSIEPVLTRMHELETAMQDKKEPLHDARRLVAKLNRD